MRQRLTGVLILTATVLMFTPGIGHAQDRRIHVNVGGGPTFNLGDMGTHFATGWGPAIGVTLDAPNRKLAFQLEYAYRYFNISDNAPLYGATTFSANHQTHQIDFNIVGNLAAPEAAVRPYIIAGPGMYYRKVEITQYVGSGVICDPFWYVCGTYPVSAVLGSRGGWDFGINVGGGVGFKIGEEAEFFVETRYHYVWGPEITTTIPVPLASGTSGKTNGSYWPLTFGFRF